MRDVKTHAQFEVAAPFNNLFNLYKDVLVALATEVPRERCHGLRNKFHAIRMEFTQTLCKTLLVGRNHGRRQWLIHGKAANIGDDHGPCGLGQEALQVTRNINNTLCFCY
jgi:hypothetical protein